MKSNITIYSEELNGEDVTNVLQAIRVCEQTNFKDKKIGIAVFLPDLKQEECRQILESVHPPFACVKAFDKGMM